MPGIQAPLALRWVLHSPGSPPYKFDPVQVRDGREFDYLRVSMAEAKVAGSRFAFPVQQPMFPEWGRLGGFPRGQRGRDLGGRAGSPRRGERDSQADRRWAV